MHTGYRQEAFVRHPEIGAMVARYLGSDELNLQSFIQLGVGGGESSPNAGSGYLGPAFQHDGAGAFRQLGRDVFRGLAEGAGFRHQPAAILSERSRDGGGDRRRIARGSGTQEESVAHVLFLA